MSNLESELELEGESELESELELMGESEFESEFEGESELEGELEGEQFLGSILGGIGGLFKESEYESELEGEFELEGEQGEQFLGRLFKRGLPFLGKLARIAAPIVGKVVSGAIPGPFGALAGKGIQGLAGLLRESEFESGELEFAEHEHELGEHEVSHELGEHELMAEAMAHYAAQAEHELEAEAMAGAAVTITLSPRDRRALRRLVPHLVRGAAILTRILRMRRDTRPWVRVVPTIVRRTARTLTRSAIEGRPVTRPRAAAVMAQQTRRVLSSPHYCTAVLRRNVRATRAVAKPVVPGRRTRSN